MSRYNGRPFSETVFAVMEDDGDGGQIPSYDDSPLTEVAMPEPRWIAKYKLVSVRKLRRKVRVTAVEVK